MGKYTEEYKAAIERRMMPPISESVVELSRETGVTTNTLYSWRKQNRDKGVVMPGKKNKTESWSIMQNRVCNRYCFQTAELFTDNIRHTHTNCHSYGKAPEHCHIPWQEISRQLPG